MYGYGVGERKRKRKNTGRVCRIKLCDGLTGPRDMYKCATRGGGCSERGTQFERIVLGGRYRYDERLGLMGPGQMGSFLTRY